MVTKKYNPSDKYDVITENVELRRDDSGTWNATIYKPDVVGIFPGLIDVHGGAWNRGERLNDASMNAELAGSGIVVCAIDYRLAPEHPYPAQICDMNYATKWFKTEATRLNVDPTTIGALGCSSGGHTVMMSAMRPKDDRYNVILTEGNTDASLRYTICCWPVLDPYSRYIYAKGADEHRLVESTEAYFLDEVTMHEGNPQEILDSGEEVLMPPTLIIQGTNDSNVPLSIPQNFKQSFTRRGGEIQLELFPGMPHGFGNTPSGESTRALELMKQFISERISNILVTA
jgi:acetyl esterase/lipase